MRSQKFGTIAPAAVLLLVVISAPACSTAMFVPPSGPGDPAAGAAEAWTAATAPCAGARSYSALLTLSGRIAGRGFPGITVITAVAADGSVHMQAHSSGRQIFLLAGRADRAWLWLRYDDNRVATGPMEDLVEALADVRLAGDDLLAILTGCPLSQEGMSDARQYRELIGITTPDGRAFLEKPDDAWRVLYAERGQLRIHYPSSGPGLPAEVRVATVPDRTPAVSLRFRAEQIELNPDLPAPLFVLPAAAASAAAMTLDELRQSGPLRGR